MVSHIFRRHTATKKIYKGNPNYLNEKKKKKIRRLRVGNWEIMGK